MNEPTTANNLEVRSISADEGREVRMIEEEGSSPKIVGYAAVFNRRSQPMRTSKGKTFVETIRPGAFKKSLAEADVRGLYNHKPDYVLGRRNAGTLRLSEDDYGLRYEIDPPDTSYARDLIASMKRGDITGSSFSFATVDDDWSQDGDGLAVRELRAAHLFDIGPVAMPAYLDATAACRSYEAFASSKADAPVLAPTHSEELARRLLRLRLAELS